MTFCLLFSFLILISNRSVGYALILACRVMCHVAVVSRKYLFAQYAFYNHSCHKVHRIVCQRRDGGYEQMNILI